jgi:hypothetical protein
MCSPENTMFPYYCLLVEKRATKPWYKTQEENLIIYSFHWYALVPCGRVCLWARDIRNPGGNYETGSGSICNTAAPRGSRTYAKYGVRDNCLANEQLIYYHTVTHFCQEGSHFMLLTEIWSLQILAYSWSWTNLVQFTRDVISLTPHR